ncbi:MAG: hypothetical protein AB7V16_03195 [Vulcanibacillus sp.]
MGLDIIKILISAGIGAFVTFIVTFVNFRIKKYELQFTYNKKLEDKYMENARKYVKEVYLPIFKVINNVEKLIDEKDFSKERIKLIEDSLREHIHTLNDTGFTAYLTDNVEIELNQFIKFLNNSRITDDLSYGIYFQYNVLGNSVNQYIEVNSEQLKDSKKILRRHRFLIRMYKFITGINIIFIPNRFMEFGQQIVLNSAPLDSEDFRFQIKKYILNIKEKIRQITLG